MIDPKELLKTIEPKQTRVLSVEPQLRRILYSPCGTMLFAGGFDGRVRRWKLEGETATEIASLAGHHGWVDAIAFRAAGNIFISGDSWGRLCCWRDYANEQPTLAWQHEAAHNGWIRGLSPSHDGLTIVSCGADGRVCGWSIDDGSKKFELAESGRDLRCVRCLPDGSILTGDDRGTVKHFRSDGGEIRAFDASQLYLLSRLQDVGGVHCLAIDASGTLVAVGGLLPKSGGTVTGIPAVLLFELATGELKQKWELGTANDCFVAEMEFRPQGFVSAITYGTPGQGQLTYLLPGEASPLFTQRQLANCHSHAWHPTGKQLVVSATNGGSNGNGRTLDKEGKYPGNQSPLHFFVLP